MTAVRTLFLGAISAILLCLPGAASPETAADRCPDGDSAEIISKYVHATESHEDTLRGASMEVDIDASVPTLKKEGRLRALRRISKVGQITYRVLGFQGDNTVKKEVIARYLTAEQQSQGDDRISITPANYKFKFKGRKTLDAGGSVYMFQLAPRKKQLGLFKGEIWLDTLSCLPVYEKGRLVKNPSVFFKKVDFEREFAIHDGVSIPQHMNSTINTRLIGRVELNINYSHFEPETSPDESSAISPAMISNVDFVH